MKQVIYPQYSIRLEGEVLPFGDVYQAIERREDIMLTLRLMFPEAIVRPEGSLNQGWRMDTPFQDGDRWRNDLSRLDQLMQTLDKENVITYKCDNSVRAVHTDGTRNPRHIGPEVKVMISRWNIDVVLDALIEARNELCEIHGIN